MIHLDCQTEYSFLRGFAPPSKWFERCVEVGASYIGFCDYVSTWGHVSFRDAPDGIEPLLGVQVPVVCKLDKTGNHALVSLLPKNGDLEPMYEAVSLAHKQVFYRPRLTWEQVQFLSGDCFVLVQVAHERDFEHITQDMFLALAPREGCILDWVNEFPTVATGAPCYPRHQDAAAFGLVQSVSEGARIGESTGGGLFLTNREEYTTQLANLGIEVKDEWFSNTQLIAEKATAKIRRAKLPAIDGPSLELLAREGAANRGCDIESGPYADRLRAELQVIHDCGFEDYFKFVADVCQWARERMLVGPGRGSSGGSLVCYLLGITNVDPIVHGTLFERFLDPSRKDLPDIDIDFPDQAREDVFNYLQQRYGADHVARLGTITRLGGASAINDTARAFQIPFTATRDIKKELGGRSLVEFFKDPPDHLKPVLRDHPDISKAAWLEGVPRNTGKHAAGVCIAAEPVSRFGVVDANGIISMDLYDAEKVGLLKLDALGLRTLSVLQDCCEQVGDLDLYGLPLDDPEVYSIFNSDAVTGVFQFEGYAVRGLLRQMEVEKFDDICALTSLARPGPLVGGAAANYVQRRSGNAKWNYRLPSLQPILGDTFGTIVYQEQVMQIAHDLCGFTGPEVNKLRKAIGKKDHSALAGLRKKFVDALGKEGKVLWDEIAEFGSYAFNKSHAVAYSMLSYYCAYFKRYHPLEFCLAQLRNGIDDEKAKALLREAENAGHKFVPFDPYTSEVDWSIQDGVLVGGYTSVRGIGRKFAEKLVEFRDWSESDAWVDELTESQRAKIFRPDNTPWHEMSRFERIYGALYENPQGFRSGALPKGALGPIYRIDELPGEKGTYTFLGKLKRRQLREKKNSDGKVIGEFCNVYFEDDTGTVGCTISTRKWDEFKWLLQAGYDEQDFIVKGSDINGDGRTWLFVDNLIPLDGKIGEGEKS